MYIWLGLDFANIAITKPGIKQGKVVCVLTFIYILVGVNIPHLYKGNKETTAVNSYLKITKSDIKLIERPDFKTLFWSQKF